MQIPNIIFILVIVIYWIFIRIPTIIKRKLKKERVEKEKLKLIGELPLILSIIFYLLAIYFVIPKTLNLGLFSIGLILFVFGAFFNEWARHVLGKQWSGAARILKKHKLVTTGPYSVVRHPMYFANILMYIGCLIIVKSYILLGLFLVISTILGYRLKIEEQELFSKFGKEYKKYREKVALIIPYIF